MSESDDHDELNDPEQSYRRGYEHGASLLFREVANSLPTASAKLIKEWLERDIHEWRLTNLRGTSTRGPDGTITPEIVPPALRLAKRSSN